MLGLGSVLNGRYWASALIVGGVTLVLAAVTGSIGWARRIRKPFERTRRELSKEVTWASDLRS